MAGEGYVTQAIRAMWHQTPVDCEPILGGMTSRAWLVGAADGRYVAKLVPLRNRAQFEAGLAAAERLDRGGLPAGAPVRSQSGALTESLDGGALGLLRFVPGRPADAGDPIDQQRWGDVLGTAHRILAGFTHPGLERWHWVRPEAPHLDLEPWLRPAVADAVAALSKLSITDQLSYGVLHGDPAPDAVRLDVHTGRTGLIDWGSVTAGPLAYDVASAVMYAGGPARATDLLEAYAAAGPMTGDEIDASLPTMLRFRWAVQADWFARRIVDDDRTGIADPAENWAGLRHAEARLT